MTEYDNTNTGVLFMNDQKKTDKHPSRKGSINIEGKEYWLSGWDRQTSKGDTVSLKVEMKEARGAFAKKPPAPAPAQEAAFEDDSEIPFN